jgi:hypothetical protein
LAIRRNGGRPSKSWSVGTSRLCRATYSRKAASAVSVYLCAGANRGVNDAVPRVGVVLDVVDWFDAFPDVYGGVGIYSGGGDLTSVATG